MQRTLNFLDDFETHMLDGIAEYADYAVDDLSHKQKMHVLQMCDAIHRITDAKKSLWEHAGTPMNARKY